MHKVRQYIIYIENVIYTNIIELTMISAFFYSLKTRQNGIKNKHRNVKQNRFDVINLFIYTF